MTEVSVGELFVRLIVSLGVVVAVMAAAAWALKRMSSGGLGAGRSRSGRPVRLEILGRQSLGRRSSLALVRFGDRGLVLGVTDQQVTLLAETDATELTVDRPEDDRAPRTVSLTDGPVDRDPAVDSPWRNLTESLRDRTVRRS